MLIKWLVVDSENCFDWHLIILMSFIIVYHFSCLSGLFCYQLELYYSWRKFLFQRLLHITVESEYKIKTQRNCNNINNKRGEVHAYISTNQNNNTSNKNNTKIRIDENNTQKIRIDKNNIFFDSPRFGPSHLSVSWLRLWGPVACGYQDVLHARVTWPR